MCVVSWLRHQNVRYFFENESNIRLQWVREITKKKNKCIMYHQKSKEQVQKNTSKRRRKEKMLWEITFFQ